MGSPNVVTVTEDNFKFEVLESEQPVMVDFWAEWCGPCKSLTPLIEELASEYLGRLKVAKVNIDECPELATAHGVRAIPTILVFKEGQVVEQTVGLKSKRELKQSLDRVAS